MTLGRTGLITANLAAYIFSSISNPLSQIKDLTRDT